MDMIMPHLRFRALESEIVKTLSSPLVDELQPLMDCPREDFTIELVSSTFYFDGKLSHAYPFVEVLWFDRGQEVKDKVAAVITEQIGSALGKELDVAVIFIALEPASYYDNGSHYG
jgi:phenylpyruvate tautomerase PptA (4-oxalocrotonate tautomerase family)